MTVTVTANRSSHVRKPLSFYIGGEWVEPSSGATIDVLDSGTEELFLTVAEAQAADVEHAVGRRLRAGTVGQNGFKLDFSIAFGGFKQSGIGREGGVEGLHPYLETSTMIFEGVPTAAK